VAPNLHKYLRRIRMQHGDLLKDMAEKLYMPPAELSAIEHGKKPMPENFLDDVDQVYGVNEQNKEGEDEEFQL